MDLKQSHNSPVLTNQVLGMPSSLPPYSPQSAAFSSTSCLAIPRRKPVNGLIETMKSSSPPCRRLSQDICLDAVFEDTDAEYNIWVSKYPSALSSFEQIINYAKEARIALFMDYDGTLSPIVDNPDHAFMSSAMRTAVRNAAKFFPSAIITGRSREKVHEFVGLEEVYYAGSHGMDLVSPVKDSEFVASNYNSCSLTVERGNSLSFFQPASEFLPMIDEVFRSLIENTKDIKGSKIENNKFCVSVHYRLVDENSWAVVAQRVHDIIKNYPRLELTYGRKVLEIRPIIDWNKGAAVKFLLDSFGLNDRGAVLPIYIGDDRSDEDAFKVLRERNRGYGIVVSSVPKETNAHFSLRDPSEVMVFLRSLVRWKKSQIAVHRSM